ncbi:MAG: hypothetical protein ACRDY2_02710, partial [Acidimicrobiales bacterium]
QADPVPSSTPSVQLGSLDIAPTSPTGLDCSGLISAGGEQLRVSGDGFTPGSSVPIYLVSPGLGSSEEVQLASVIADATGTVNSVITIPLSAKGFSEPDLGAGLAFLNAEGSGSQAASVNDLGMVGLTPVADACASSGPTSSAGLLGSVLNGLLGSSSSGGLLRLSGLGGLLGIPLAVPAKGGSTAR